MELPKKTFVWIFAMFICFWMIPPILQFLEFSPRLILDWEGFTETWYTTLIDIGKILGGFVLVNIIWEDYKRQNLMAEKKEKLYDLISNWLDQLNTANSKLNGLIEIINSNKLDAYPQVIGELNGCKANLNLLTDLLQNSSRDLASIKVLGVINEYKNDIAQIFAELIHSIDEKDLYPGRRIRDKDQVRLDKLREYFAKVSNTIKTAREN